MVKMLVAVVDSVSDNQRRHPQELKTYYRVQYINYYIYLVFMGI